MIVDDQSAQEWYERMISVGFKDIPGQQGFFPDCESALEALETGHYDVILTDLDLGNGKMNGIDFVEKAFTLLTSKGVTPRISVFSYDDKLLAEAEKRLHVWKHSDNSKVFQQVNYNNKTDFSAMTFRISVARLLDNQRRFGANHD